MGIDVERLREAQKRNPGKTGIAVFVNPEYVGKAMSEINMLIKKRGWA